MTVNRRTKKATTRQPAAPKAQSQPTKTIAVEAAAANQAEAAAQPVVTEEPAPKATSSTTEGSHAMSQEEAVQVEPKPVEAKPVKAKPAKGAIVHQTPSLSIWDRPIMPSEVEVVGTLQMAGDRPVTASAMSVFGTFLNGRPIESSGLKLYDELPGARPIFFSEFHAVEGLDLPGGRPVMASAAGLMAAEKLPGDRPIFSNEIDNPYELMGFLD